MIKQNSHHLQEICKMQITMFNANSLRKTLKPKLILRLHLSLTCFLKLS